MVVGLLVSLNVVDCNLCIKVQAIEISLSGRQDRKNILEPLGKLQQLLCDFRRSTLTRSRASSTSRCT